MKQKKAKEITAFKVISWFKKSNMSVEYGIDGKVDGKWYHLMEIDKPLFFKTEAEAKLKQYPQLQAYLPTAPSTGKQEQQ